MTFHDTVLDRCVVTDVHVIQNDGIPDGTVVADVAGLKHHGILHYSVYDAAAGYQAVMDRGSRIELCGRQIVHLGVDIGQFPEEIVPHFGFEEFQSIGCRTRINSGGAFAEFV